MVFEFSFDKAYEVLRPLVFFVLGMSVYSFFIFKFYRFLASRDIIKLNLHSYNSANHWMLKSFFSILLYILEYIILMPVFIFFWFAVLALLLTFLSKNQPIETILLVAIAVVGAVRMAAYYKEDLSKDLSKMLPFALLGVFLVDISYFNLSETLGMIFSIVDNLELLIYYLGFIIVLEFVLRVFSIFLPEEKKELEN